ncbi:MAG: M61 family metallopeptidase [Acidobacteriota bacterium]
MNLARARVFLLALATCTTIAVPPLAAVNAAADSPPAVTYTISLAKPEQHLAHVQILLPAGHPVRELQLPVWNALYQIRDFSQYLNWIRARDRAGTPLAIRELDKSRWQIEGAADGAVVEYDIYLDTPGPFGAQLNAHHAFFNLAEVLMYPVDARNSRLTLHFSHVPSSWHIATPLQAADDAYVAENYDRLVDSPVEIGTFRETDFDEFGAHFRVVIDADQADYNADQIKDSLHRIVAAAINWMNDCPFKEYVFIYHFPRGPAGGGMEHTYATAIDLNAGTIQRTLYPLNSVSAHEFFHLWNVKRIRPRSLEPIDYTKENYTRALWFSEGVTSTVENVIQFRAGLIGEKEVLANVAQEITELENRPAHLTQSAEDSSLNAWLEGFNYYRRSERSVSYYNKGELLGILLDLTVREQSHGQASLRDVLQWMNRNYAQKGQFFDDSRGVRDAAEAVSHADLATFFQKYVAGTEEIPWSDFFRSVGLHVEAVDVILPDPGFSASRNFDGPLAVDALTPGSDAEQQGLRLGDVILEFQGKAVAEDFYQQLSRVAPGQTVRLKVRSGRAGERELKWKMGSRQQGSYQLKDLDQITPEQQARRAAWLKGESQTASGAAAQ